MVLVSGFLRLGNLYLLTGWVIDLLYNLVAGGTRGVPLHESIARIGR